ncbi:MAG: CPBP family intramembrane glutamic endopeptidase [Terracidiphilus sp.]|jgi:membrane protease YdiL (CAAX protease family)
MQANEIREVEDSEARHRPTQIASWAHLAGFLLIGAGVVALGFLAQHAPSGSGGAAPGQLASHSKAIPIYLTAILMDWALLYYCWGGVHHRRGNLWALSGGRWKSWKDVAIDVGVAMPFWVFWTGTAYGVHWLLAATAGPGSAKTVDSLLPQSLLEILVWIATSITAGICEEMAFRGYLQRQLHALSGNVVAAVLAQGLVFGLFHSYQGWTNVIVISVLGALYGALAAWRRNLRANMIVHAWGDVWEGWLKFVVWR